MPTANWANGIVPSRDQVEAYNRSTSLADRGGVLFLTGNAGTGKSTVLENIRQSGEEGVVFLAPTGVAALNIGGQTINSFFKLEPRPYNDEDETIRRSESTRFRRKLQSIELLVIDEISMVRADMLAAVDRSLRVNTGNPLPFGGKPILVVGDLMQLPPVVETREERVLLAEQFGSPFFFSTQAIRNDILEVFKLSTPHRQNSDEDFYRLLNLVRLGSPDCLEELRDRVNLRPELGAGAIVLTSTNESADALNWRRFTKLGTACKSFMGEFDGDFLRKERLPAPLKLDLRSGAQVMFTKNHRGWRNGDIGEVVSVDEQPIVRLHGSEFEVERATWDSYRHEWSDATGRIRSEVVGQYRQYPLKLAWAVTIHRAQGLTFDQVHVDLGLNARTHGLTYTALSRCRTLEGLSLRFPIEREDLAVDPLAMDFA